MKKEMKIGEYTRLGKKSYRCMADSHSQMKRCILCDLHYSELCDFVLCQPDERDDHQAVIFQLTRKFKKENRYEEK